MSKSSIKSPPVETIVPTLRIAGEKTVLWDRVNERLSEWCSSILVKETRQAIKSRQFLWTYFLLLAAVGLWTVIGITFQHLNFDIGTAGRTLLYGLFVIMGFPLGIVIPFSAYRSLAREFEDGTIQLISITTMKPSQIILGKFGSAVLQMLVYLSVLAPCILFTYLLRGISLPQILWGMGICVGISICLTILGLFLAGALRHRGLGIGVSVLFVLLLGWVYFLWVAGSSALTQFAPPGFDVPEFAVSFYGVVAFFGSSAVLLLVTAAAQISFETDNRSTRIRFLMLVQQALFWSLLAMVAQIVPFQQELLFVMALFAGHYWLLMGFLMIGESPKISRRIKRTLPTTIFSRSVASFLMPGPGRGFLYALVMIWSCGCVLVLVAFFQENIAVGAIRSQSGLASLGAFGRSMTFKEMAGIGVCCFYVSLFLAISYLIARWRLHSSRFELASGLGPLINLFVGVVMVGLTTFTSLIIHFRISHSDSQSDYSAIDIFNWYWTVFEFTNRRQSPELGWLIVLVLPGTAIILTAVWYASRELLSRPLAIPERVLVEQQKPAVQLPAGESIEEIFGELK